MDRVAKLYNIDRDVLKQLFMDGVLNPNYEYWLEIYEHYKEMERVHEKKMDAVYNTCIHYAIEVRNFYTIKNKIEGLSPLKKQAVGI